jgi:hypothetical protein
MKKTALLLSSIVSLGFALSPSEIYNSTLINNHDLNSIEKSIAITNENIKLSTKWQNPVLSIGANDIQFEDTLSRDKEAMQGQFIGLSQVIPMGNKLDIKKSIAKKDKNIVILDLEDKKLQLKAKIYEASYNIFILEEKLKLLNSYAKNIKKVEKLSTSLYKYNNSNQNMILESKIQYTQIQIQKQNIENSIKNLYLKLEQISHLNIDSIEIPLLMKKASLQMDINSHPKILIKEEKIKKFNKISELEKENKKSDIKVNLTYFNRDSKYKDYAKISLSMPLSVYKTEDIKSLKAKLEVNKLNDTLHHLKLHFNTELKSLENNMNTSLSNYNLIKTSILPLKNKIQKNMENYNTFTNIKPENIINNLNKIISYEIKALNQKKEYFSNLSKSKYYEVKVK